MNPVTTSGIKVAYTIKEARMNVVNYKGLNIMHIKINLYRVIVKIYLIIKFTNNHIIISNDILIFGDKPNIF